MTLTFDGRRFCIPKYTSLVTSDDLLRVTIHGEAALL